jgi:hypothetical protein
VRPPEPEPAPVQALEPEPVQAPAAEVVPAATAPAQPPPAVVPRAEPSPTRNWAWAKPAPVTAVGQDGGSVPSAVTQKGEKKGRKLPWRGTTFSWSNAVTTSAVGVGADYLSSAHQVYIQTYSLLLNYYLFEGERWTVRTSAAPGFEVELTDSASTTTRREPGLVDTAVSLVAANKVYNSEKSGWGTAAVGNLTLLLPTSEVSRESGTYLTLSPRAALAQKVPLLGPSSSWLKTVTFAGGIRWDHLFSAATTPVNDELAWPAQDLGGRALQSDLLSGDRFAPNTYRVAGSVEFSEELFGNPLELQLSAYYQSASLYGVGNSTLELSTGPYTVEPAPGARNAQPSVGVVAALTYIPTPELAVSVGYSSRADLHSESPEPLYNPRALFLGTVSVSLDALYLRFKGESAQDPTFIGRGARRRAF